MNEPKGTTMNLAATIQERLKGFFPELLGIRLIEATPDVIRAELEARPAICTLPGIIHGGALMGFADTLGAVATVLNMPPKSRTTTIESKTNFFRALRSDGKIIGECTALHKGKTTMVWQTRIYDENENLAAQVIQTQIVIPS